MTPHENRCKHGQRIIAGGERCYICDLESDNERYKARITALIPMEVALRRMAMLVCKGNRKGYGPYTADEHDELVALAEQFVLEEGD